MSVFCGWFDGIKRPSFKSKKPQEYHCLGHSAILYHEGLEWNFVNRSDGDQELRCDLQLYNGWYSDPVKS